MELKEYWADVTSTYKVWASNMEEAKELLARYSNGDDSAQEFVSLKGEEIEMDEGF